jgi:tetratricopeptide (TPR) repeat protein
MEQEIKSSPRFDFNRIFEYCLLALVFLAPIFFYPSVFVSLYSAKLAFLVTVTAVFIAVFFASILAKGSIQIPRLRFLIPIAVLPLVALLSSFFSGQVIKSITGEIFEMGTSGSLFIFSLLFFVAILAVKEDARVGIKSVFALMISSIVVILHLVLRMFAGFVLPEALTSRIPNFLLGGSVDTAIFLGAVAIASLTALNLLSFDKRIRIALYVLLVASMIFVGAVGFMPVIVLLGLFALFYFIYTFSWSMSRNPQENNHNESASFQSLFVLIFSIVLILSNGALSGYLSGVFKMNSIEVRPNLEVTMNLVGEAWKKNAALGTGPNAFKELWDLKKPADINLTQFWGSSFYSGSGLVPTLAITTGLLGLLTLLAFLALYISAGFKAIFAGNNDSSWHYLSLTSFLVSLYLWIVAFVHVPGISVVSLMFIFSGIFAATLVPKGVASVIRVNIFANPKTNFVSVFGIVVLLVFSVAGGYFVWERVVTASIYQKGVNQLLVGDNLGAKNYFATALRLAPYDLYWKSFSEASLNQVGVLLNSISSPNNLTDSERTAIQSEIADAVESAKQAIAWNPKDYENWFVLGRVYEVLATNGIQGASENAKEAFKEAQIRSPLNPAIPLAFGRLAAVAQDLTGARENINRAIELKNNYTDAYFTLAQLEVSANNVPAAVKSIESVIMMDPQNAGLYFQLGLLKYNNQDFSGASVSFERAVSLVPSYANAQYFLGLSYDKLGKRSEALAMFEEIQKTNPDNSEISLIVSNLKAGKAPFIGAKPPIDDKPEKRAEPPMNE